MKILLRVIRIFLFAVLAGLLVFGMYAWQTLKSGAPRVSGEIKAAGIQSPVKVIRDRHGVPHILAENELDLFYAIGFVQAQDRMWQMDLMRRLAEGRTSEIFGVRPQTNDFSEGATTYDLDLFSRVAGFAHYGKKMDEIISPESRSRIEAYCDGVNAWIANNRRNLPPEFKLLGYSPELWTPHDSAAIALYIAWGLSSDWDMELMRLAARDALGEERMWELFPKHEDPGPFIIPREMKDYRAMERSSGKKEAAPARRTGSLPAGLIDRLLGLEEGLEWGGGRYRAIPAASNNWVVSGRWTASGLPILANDPHLPHLTPSIFYPMHQSLPGLDVAGVGFPGSPFVLIGHNRRVAWGATTTWADTQDLFIERLKPDDPGRYLHNDRWEPFEIRKETIRYKKGAVGAAMGEKTVAIRTSRHGPILNDAAPELLGSGAPPAALRWTGHFPSDPAGAYWGLANARDVFDVRAAAEKNGVPISNVVAADIEGNIAYFPLGHLPDRKKGDGSFPVPGWTDEFDWKDDWVPLDEMPQAVNPERGYIVTANNKVVPEDDYPYVMATRYMHSYRARRIEQLISAKAKHTPDDMRAHQLDVKALQAERLAPVLTAAARKRGAGGKSAVHEAALEAFEKWDFQTGPEEVGPSIFYRVYEETIRLTLEDDLPKPLYKRYMKDWTTDVPFDNALERGTFSFFDDASTPDVREDRDDIAARAFVNAVNRLKKDLGDDVAEWRWGRLHQMTFSHPLGSQKPLDRIFNDGPAPIGGARAVVMAESFAYGGPNYPNLYGPAFRFVVDMADPDGATMSLDSGASGHWRSPHYLDLGKIWMAGKTVPMVSSRTAAGKEGSRASTLLLRPVNE